MYNYHIGGAAFWVTFVGATVLYRRYRGGLFFIAAFPGTLAHELAHYITALLMRGKPSPIDMVPKKIEDGWRLGSVAFVPNFFNGSFVALAPLLLFPTAWLLAKNAGHFQWSTQLWLGYVAGCLANSALPSSADWKIVRDYPLGFILLLLIGAALWNMRHLAAA